MNWNAHFAFMFVLLLLGGTNASASCQTWFDNGKLKKDKSCLTKCATLPVDMAAFSCPGECAELCKVSSSEKFLFQLSDLYPGLTAKERAIAATEPVKVLQAYHLSWRAESKCLELYPSSETNDESDACRHFVWAGLLVNELGKDFAENILDAHEQEPAQPENEKAMDLANNRRGISAGENLVTDQKFSEEAILNSFKEQLKQGNLIILKSRNGKAQ